MNHGRLTENALNSSLIATLSFRLQASSQKNQPSTTWTDTMMDTTGMTMTTILARRKSVMRPWKIFATTSKNTANTFEVEVISEVVATVSENSMIQTETGTVTSSTIKGSIIHNTMMTIQQTLPLVSYKTQIQVCQITKMIRVTHIVLLANKRR